MNPFKAIADFFRRLVSYAPKTADVLDSISDLVKMALPIVGAIAAATPNRSDDQVLALVSNVGLPTIGLAKDWLRNDQLVKDALRASAVAELRKKGVTDPDSVVNAAVELAYSIYKAEK